MSDTTCKAYNEPAGGTSLLRCDLPEGHPGPHEGAFGTMVIRGVTQGRYRRWDDADQTHRTAEQAREWAARP